MLVSDRRGEQIHQIHLSTNEEQTEYLNSNLSETPIIH